MTTDVTKEFERATAARLTDEDIERDRLQLGIQIACDGDEFFSTATPEVMRNYAASYGDDNPLYADPAYGAATRWGGQVAPPHLVANLNRGLAGNPLDPEIKRRVKGAYRGVHNFLSGGSWDFYAQIHAGDTIYAFDGLESLEARPSKFAGRSVFRTTRRVKFNQRGEVVAVLRRLMIFAERSAAKKTGKYAGVEPASYTQEDLDRIDAVYEAERRRASEPRYWEDVEVGEALQEMVKGPLRTTDIILFHQGGYGRWPYQALSTGRLGYKNRQRIPAFYVKNANGVPDVVQRVHWDSDWAAAVGTPIAYDYGALRQCWLQHLVTNWMGDDAFLLRQHDEIRKFNYLADTTWLTGTVTGKRVEDGRQIVELELRATNQRGEETVRSTAEVLLPSRESGAVVLPKPPAELERQAAVMLARDGELRAAKS